MPGTEIETIRIYVLVFLVRFTQILEMYSGRNGRERERERETASEVEAVEYEEVESQISDK